MSNRFLDLLHKSFLNQTTLNLRKEKWGFLNRDLPVHIQKIWLKVLTMKSTGKITNHKSTNKPKGLSGLMVKICCMMMKI